MIKMRAEAKDAHVQQGTLTDENGKQHPRCLGLALGRTGTKDTGTFGLVLGRTSLRFADGVFS